MYNDPNFSLSFKMGMEVEAENRGSTVLKNRGIIQKKKKTLRPLCHLQNTKMETGDCCYLVAVTKLKGCSLLLLLHFRYLSLFHMSLNICF